jgi:hypothetical protein
MLRHPREETEHQQYLFDGLSAEVPGGEFESAWELLVFPIR